MEQKFLGKPFAVVSQRVKTDGNGRTDIVARKDKMEVGLDGSCFYLLTKKVDDLDFKNNEYIDINHSFNAMIDIQLAKTSISTYLIDDVEYPMNHTLFCMLEFNANIVISKDAQGQYKIHKAKVLDFNSESSNFTYKRVASKDSVPHILSYKDLVDQDICDPNNENISVKNEVITDIIKSINVLPMLIGSTFSTQKWWI